ncbi:MAG: hypothetical protein QOG89_2919 [Thermomicrobiales bacterium]|nr:hypothetical protein [Thermomicrobiales bacterium]
MDDRESNGHSRTTAWQLDDVMDIASRLAGHDAVGAIHVAVADRPTYDDILHYRRLAEANGLSLTLTVDSVVLRPLPEKNDGETRYDFPGPNRGVWGPALGNAAERAWHWLHRHASSWQAGFQGLNEGTR